MNPRVRSPLPLPQGLTRRSIESKTLANRTDTRVNPAYDSPPDRATLQRAYAEAEIRDSTTDITLNKRDFHWLSALVALPARACAGRPFFNSAVRALVAKRLDIDVPIGIAVVLALGLSIFETSHHPTHAYFDSALILTAFLLVGPALEKAMRRRTRAAARDFADLRTQTVTK